MVGGETFACVCINTGKPVNTESETAREPGIANQVTVPVHPCATTQQEKPPAAILCIELLQALPIHCKAQVADRTSPEFLSLRICIRFEGLYVL